MEKTFKHLFTDTKHSVAIAAIITSIVLCFICGTLLFVVFYSLNFLWYGVLTELIIMTTNIQIRSLIICKRY